MRTRTLAVLLTTASTGLAVAQSKLPPDINATSYTRLPPIDRASLAEEPPYAVGDPIIGTLLIDTALAPADKLLLDPQIGRYYGITSGADLMLGPKHPNGNAPGDLVLGLQWPSSPGRSFVDDSLSQSVEREPDASFWGYIERGFGALWQIVSFTADRLSMKPRVCKP